MKVALCVIGRLENDYATEWVEHHISIGFDHIVIADNNHNGEERFESVLSDYIKKKKVTILDFRDMESAQRMAYNTMYDRYKDEYDWIAFFDFDEFLCINDGKSVKELLSMYEGKADCMMIPWMMMTDNGLVRKDSRPLMERFTEKASDFDAGKGIVHGGINGLRYTKSVHVPYQPTLRCISPNGNPCKQKRVQKSEYSVAYLKHFSTKTIEEWLTNKCRKGTAGRSLERFKSQYKDYFFMVNKRTQEKEQFITEFERNNA